MDRTELLSQILDSLPVFIGLVNAHQVYEFVNATYEARYGLRRQEIIGKTVEELNGTKEYERSRQKIEAVLRGERVEFEYCFEGLTHLMRYEPRIENDRVTGYFVLSTDITQLKSTTSQLELNQTELICTRTSFENFSSFIHHDRIATVGAMAVGFTHDISRPVSVMNILIDSLRSSLKGTIAEQSTRHSINSLQDQVQYTADLINRQRRFAAKQAIERRKSGLSQILNDSLAMMKPRIAANRIELNLDIQDKNAEAIVDPIEIQQVLVNLIVNAVESVSGNPEGERSLGICGKLQSDGIYEYRVADNGKGVSEDMIGKLFEAFESDKQSGIGMGLAISRILVENNGGTLELAERGDSGAEFVCRIPIINKN